MDAPLRHFAINADDVDTAREFYEAVFGWSFSEYAPGFLRSERPDGTVCAIQQRRDLGGVPMRGLECTFAVDDVRVFADTVRAHGGRVLMEPATIAGVGELVFVEDPGGNVFGAMAYLS
jgi:predicted enzyme related to lactoylglutathione lyase